MLAVKILRPSRWDIPFSEEQECDLAISDEFVDEILEQPPFSEIDPAGFRKSLSLRNILKNDIAIKDYSEGDIIVRRDDWGNSAFFILAGTVRVDLESDGVSLTDDYLGRNARKKKSFFESVAQLWNNSKESEVRTNRNGAFSSPVALRNGVGTSQIYLQDVSAVLDQYRTAQMNAGQWFGELAALGRTSRVATIFSESNSRILEIRWQGLRDIMRFDRNGKLKNYIEEVFRERALESFLRNHSFFQSCSHELMKDVVDQCEFQSYGDYDSAKPFKKEAPSGTDFQSLAEPIIVEEGDYLNSLILVRNGVARLSQKHHHGRITTGYLTAGQMTGLSELPHNASFKDENSYESRLSAIGYLNVVKVPSFLVEKIVREKESLGIPVSPIQLKKNKDNQSKIDPDESFLNFLVDRKYAQGTSLMVIDLDRCTRCDDCVKACATAHDNNPRFIRHGPIHGKYMIPNSCLHCSDPVCMIECPTGAIHRDQIDGTIIINEQTCIGCAQCANNCPFDAIRMVNIRDSIGNIIVDSKNQIPLMEATKCDHCVDQIGPPSCQQACPHEALIRINMQSSKFSGKVS
jgi:Fe-S-cluster-containing dehydrogenase component/CRP-like cAMP-binding protein